jgi:hypothetical protein
MPTAIHDPTIPTRRSAIGFSVAALTAGLTVPAVAAIAGPDAELVEAAEHALRCECRIHDIDNGPGETDDAADAANNAWDAAFRGVASLQAMTLNGFRAKALALQAALKREHMIAFGHGPQDVFEPADLQNGCVVDSWLAWSLCCDLLGMPLPAEGEAV